MVLAYALIINFSHFFTIRLLIFYFWVIANAWSSDFIFNCKNRVVDSDFPQFCKLLHRLCFLEMDNFLFFSHLEAVCFVQLNNFKTTNWRMGWKPTNFGIVYFLVKPLRTLFLTDYLINVLHAWQLLFFFVRNVWILQKLSLNFSKIL